jgi:cell division protein FtsL
MIINSMANANNALAQYTQPQYSQPQPKAVARTIAPVTGAAARGFDGARFDGSRFTAVVLLLATIASGMMLVYSRHQARTLFQQLEALSTQHDEQQIEWGRLQLEQATWSENSRIEQIARDRLGLDFPEQTKVVVIKQ